MAASTGPKAIQGTDPRNEVFKNIYPVLYAASNPVDGGYSRSSEICAALAHACSGIEGGTVLDLGCGYGITTIAIAAYAPESIFALDNSPAMIELMRLILESDEPIASWLEARGTEELLPSHLLKGVCAHFEAMRAGWKNGLFMRRGGALRISVEDGANADRVVDEVGTVIGNNYLHWIVNQQIASLAQQEPVLSKDERFRRAFVEAMTPLRRVLRRGSIAVFMEPKDFVSLDDEPELDGDLERNTMANHPFFVRFHATVNRLLKGRHGIDRAVPTTAGLFKTSQLPDLIDYAGFALHGMHHVEWVYNADPLDVCFVRLPLLLGSIAIPFEAKVALGRDAAGELRSAELTPEEREPIRAQWFYFVLQAV